MLTNDLKRVTSLEAIIKKLMYQFIVRTSRGRENEVLHTSVSPLRCFYTLVDYYFECDKVGLYIGQINSLLALIFSKLCRHTGDSKMEEIELTVCHEYFLRINTVIFSLIFYGLRRSLAKC